MIMDTEKLKYEVTEAVAKLILRKKRESSGVIDASQLMCEDWSDLYTERFGIVNVFRKEVDHYVADLLWIMDRNTGYGLNKGE